MAKLTLLPIGDILSSESIINANNDRIETALENTLSRDGTAPNEMNSDLDMNDHRIYNLGYPVTDNEPVRRSDLDGIFDLYEGLNEALADAEASAATAVDAATDAEAAQLAAEAAQAAAEAAAVSISVQSVANLTALKALDTTTVAAAYLQTSGRNGWFKWTLGDFSSQITFDTTEAVYVKADAIASATGAWVRSFFGPVDPRWFGVTLGSTASDTAFTAFINFIVNYGLQGRLPAGTISFSASAVFNIGDASLDLQGEGLGISVLQFKDTAINGLAITHSDNSNALPSKVTLRDFSVLTEGASTGTGILVEVNPLIAYVYSASAQVQRVEVRGLDPANDYWDDGIILADEHVSFVTDCFIKGKSESVQPFSQTSGINLIRCNDCHVTGNHILHVQNGIVSYTDSAGYGEGVYISDNRVVGANIGINVDGTVGAALMGINSNHVNTSSVGILANRVYFTPIKNNLIFQTNTETLTFTGVQLSGVGSEHNIVADNQIKQPGVTPSGKTNFGIFVSSDFNSLKSNHFTGTTDTFYGVYWDTGAQNNLGSENIADSTVNSMYGGAVDPSNLELNSIGP